MFHICVSQKKPLFALFLTLIYKNIRNKEKKLNEMVLLIQFGMTFNNCFTALCRLSCAVWCHFAAMYKKLKSALMAMF